MKRRALASGLLLALAMSVSASQVAPSAGVGGATLSGKVTLLLPPKVKIDPGGSVVWIPGLTVNAPAPSAISVTS